MNKENLFNDIEAVLDEIFDKNEYEGSYISVSNSVEGLTGNIKCDEETDVVICNKNLLDMSKEKDKLQSQTSIGFSQQSASQFTIVATDVNLNSWTQWNLINPMKLKENTKYVIGLNIFNLETGEQELPTSGKVAIDLIDSNNVSLLTSALYRTFSNNSSNILDTSGIDLSEIAYVRFGIYWLYGDYNHLFQVQFEEAETPTDYVEHQEQNYTGTNIDFRCYDEVTHIYNTNDVNMKVLARTRKEE